MDNSGCWIILKKAVGEINPFIGHLLCREGGGKTPGLNPSSALHQPSESE